MQKLKIKQIKWKLHLIYCIISGEKKTSQKSTFTLLWLGNPPLQPWIKFCFPGYILKSPDYGYNYAQTSPFSPSKHILYPRDKDTVHDLHMDSKQRVTEFSLFNLPSFSHLSAGRQTGNFQIALSFFPLAFPHKHTGNETAKYLHMNTKLKMLHILHTVCFWYHIQ